MPYDVRAVGKWAKQTYGTSVSRGADVEGDLSRPMYIWYLPFSGGNCPPGAITPCQDPSLKVDSELILTCRSICDYLCIDSATRLSVVVRKVRICNDDGAPRPRFPQQPRLQGCVKPLWRIRKYCLHPAFNTLSHQSTIKHGQVGSYTTL
jgi:hypothetical protein